MMLTLEISPEVQRELIREAEARGVALLALAAQFARRGFGTAWGGTGDGRDARPSRSKPGSIRSRSFRTRFPPCQAKPSLAA